MTMLDSSEARESVLPEPMAIKIRKEPLTYREGGPHSFFVDLAATVLRPDDDRPAARLARHQKEMSVELRDQSLLETRVNPDTTAGFGGEFAPPLWLEDKFKIFGRAGRTFADLCPNMLLPRGVSQVHLPKVGLGFTDDIQPTQDEPEAGTDITSSDVGQGQVVTLAGEAVVSQQLFELNPLGFDAVAYRDLNSDYNAKLENQLINGTGINGQVLGLANFSIPAANTIAGSGFNSIATLWPGLGQAMAVIGNNRKLQPEAWVMAPRRWAWIASSVDSQNRPIDTPRNVTISQSNIAGGYPSIGLIDGIPVYLSGAVTAGTSADNIYCTRPSDMILLESVERYLVLQQVLAGTLQTRLALHRYAAFVGNTYSNGLSVISAVPAPANF